MTISWTIAVVLNIASALVNAMLLASGISAFPILTGCCATVSLACAVLLLISAP